uniref:Proline rich 23A n=1 Tax=Oryctolagus cuniculus TaxID=9986 RepID=A0A5F9C4W2_RABIT
MRGVRPRSPSACPEPAGPPQPGAAGPAKRRRVQEPAAAEPGPQPGLPAPPAAPPASALPSVVVVVLAAGCALQLPLDDVDLLLEPAPTAVLSVSLPGHTLLLVPEGLLEAAGQDPSPGGLALAAVLDAAAEAVVVQQQQQQQQSSRDWCAQPPRRWPARQRPLKTKTTPTPSSWRCAWTLQPAGPRGSAWALQGAPAPARPSTWTGSCGGRSPALRSSLSLRLPVQGPRSPRGARSALLGPPARPGDACSRNEGAASAPRRHAADAQVRGF